MAIAEIIFEAELKWGRKISVTMTFACVCDERINETNENETSLFVCVFTQPNYSRFSGREEQPLNLAMPRASTSAAADEVKHFYLLFSCITAGNINKFG